MTRDSPSVDPAADAPRVSRPDRLPARLDSLVGTFAGTSRWFRPEAGRLADVLIGLMCACGAALAYGFASILQAIGARRAAAAGGSLAGLAAQPIYYVGLALDGLGFVGAVVALHFLPLFLVQAVVAASVVVTAVVAAALGARLGRTGVLALATAVVGLILLAISAQPEPATTLPTAWRWLVFGCVLPIALLGWWASRRRRVPVVALAAGLAFSLVAISARALVIPDPFWRVLTDPALWALAANGIAGTLLFATAVQLGEVTRIAAVTFTTETVLPAAIGLLFLGDQVRSGFWVVAALGFVLAICGAVGLSRFSEPEGVLAAPTSGVWVPADGMR